MKLSVFLGLFIISMAGHGQVKHNFKVNATKTDCHALENVLTIPTDSIASSLLGATYRFSEEMQISKYRTPRSVTYMSCDGSVGLMLAQENDALTALYENVPKTLWDSFTNTTDPISFYNSSIFKKYLVKNFKH